MGGKNSELQLVNTIIENTDELTDAYRPDFSGNSKHAVADVIVGTKVGDELQFGYIELKTRSEDSGKRSIVMAGSSQDQNGIEELTELIENTPPWADPYLVVKFNNREAIIVRADSFKKALLDDDGNTIHDSRLTGSGNISMRKPTLDDYPSQTAGQPMWEKVMDALWT
jgi:hypothetical protein